MLLDYLNERGKTETPMNMYDVSISHPSDPVSLDTYLSKMLRLTCPD